MGPMVWDEEGPMPILNKSSSETGGIISPLSGMAARLGPVL
jgi:hypothetical protein